MNLKSPTMSSTKGLGQKILHGVPLTALAYEMPSDGIPLFPTWRNNAMDIYWSGYDSLREPMECKERNLSAAHWQLQCTKGLGRPVDDLVRGLLDIPAQG